MRCVANVRQIDEGSVLDFPEDPHPFSVECVFVVSNVSN